MPARDRETDPPSSSRAARRTNVWRTIVARRWRGHPATWLVPLALALNVTALLTPFLEMRRGLSNDVYGLPRSVELLWTNGLYVLAAIVVAFSVVFPLAKLALLARILRGGVRRTRARAQLEWLERLGKWSMLDVFLVCLMIALASGQWLVGARPRYGILCFTLAIVLGMTASASMRARVAPERRESSPERPPLARVLGQAFVCAVLTAAWCVPFVEIDDWLLADRPVSIAGAVAGLWSTGAYTLASVVAAFLVLAPLAAEVGALLAFAAAWRGRAHGRFLRAAEHARRWAMLDVFALALAVFLVEGRSFVRTELSWGALLLAALLLVYWPASAWQARLAGRVR